MALQFPDELRYTEDHEWVRRDEDLLIIGITDFAQKELGDIVYVDIETEGETLDAGEEFGNVEAVKTVSDLFMPVAGEVVEVNSDLDNDPAYVNSSPYELGWMIKIRPTDAAAFDTLMDAGAYRTHLGMED